MKNFLRFIFIVIVLAIGIYIGINYNEYRRTKQNENIAVNNINENANLNTSTIIENDEEKEDSNDVENIVPNSTSSKNDFIITYEDEEYVGKTSNGIKVGTNKRNLPIIKSKSNQEAADKIVAELTKISNKMWDEITKEIDEYAKEHEDITKEDEFGGVGVDYIISTGYKNNKVITFNITMSGSMGGTGWSGYEGYNFDVETGKLLKLKDVVKDYNSAKKYIVRQIEKDLEKKDLLNEIKEFLATDNSSITSKIEEYIDSGIWYFYDGKLMITMPKYSIGYGALGIITVEIDGEDFNEYLKDEYIIKM